MLIVAVLAVAYGTATPTLGVAEFAPTAREAIEPPPPTSPDGGRGSASGGRSGRATTTTVAVTATTSGDGSTSAAPTTRVGRGRACFGEPPRQTPDPQAPSCLPTIYDGDNGGATSKGVTSTEIKVALPITAPTTPTFHAPLFEYFNRHYELYGRRLVPVYTGSPSTSTPAAARAAAATIADQQVFAVFPGNGAETAFHHELARQKVITVGQNRGYLFEDRTMLDPLHPYAWTVYPSLENMSRNIADLACTALADRPAKIAGGDLAKSTRKFGVIATGAIQAPPTRPMVDAFAACGISPRVSSMVGSDSTQRRQILEGMKADGVTTIVCLCYQNSAIDMNKLASSTVGYRPEWLQMTRTAVDDWFGNFFTRGAPELFQFLDVTPAEKLLPMQARPSFAALMEVAPDLPNPTTYHFEAQFLYQQLAILSAGIQGAGPELTPDAFGQALMSMEFPNAGAGQAPFWQPRVGFGPGDHSFFSDFAVAWWDLNQPVYDSGSPADRGSWCYLGRGARFQVGQYPTDLADRLFSPSETCR